MPITPCFDPTTGASGGAAPGGGTAPGLTVTGRTNGSGYTVTAGARSLSISNPDAATLLTTVKKASDNSSITVTNSSNTNPSWSAPAGGADGESVQVKVTATKDGLTTTVAFTERVVSTGLQDIALDEIDLTDGTWTLEDPDGLVDTVSFASGQNTVTFNLTAGSSNYNIASGTNFRGPRWYKLLSISGQQATSAMPIVFVTRVEPDNSAASDFNQRHVIGTSFDPTATVTNTINGAGAGWQINSGGSTIQMGAWARSAVNLTSNALNQRQIMASLRGFESLGTPSFLNLRSNDVCLATGARNSAANAIGGNGANLYVMVALGSSSNTTGMAAGDEAIFKASFVATSYTGI